MKRLKSFYSYLERHKRHAPTVALVFGFIWDFATLGRPDTLFANVTIISYLVIAGGAILILNSRSEREKEPLFLVVLVQFCFGNLASGLFVLYSQSATLVGSWLFLAILGLFVLANEFAKARYTRLRFQLVAYHALLTAYLALVVPILVGKLGWFIFLLSLGVALAVMLLYLVGLYAIATKRVREDWRITVRGLLSVTALFSVLYYFNLIPPVPLSLKDIEIYHSVVRAPVEYAPAIYEARTEAPTRFSFLTTYLRIPTLHVVRGNKIYCYSAVFAPNNLSAPIYHRYSRYDEGSREWIPGDVIAFPIRGGRDDGYRGYTIATVAPGRWRCSVETEGGALIGRMTFEVMEASSTPTLVTEYR